MPPEDSTTSLTDPVELRRDLTTVRAMCEAIGGVLQAAGLIDTEGLQALTEMALAQLVARQPDLRVILSKPKLILPPGTGN